MSVHAAQTPPVASPAPRMTASAGSRGTAGASIGATPRRVSAGAAPVASASASTASTASGRRLAGLGSGAAVKSTVQVRAGKRSSHDLVTLTSDAAGTGEEPRSHEAVVGIVLTTAASTGSRSAAAAAYAAARHPSSPREGSRSAGSLGGLAPALSSHNPSPAAMAAAAGAAGPAAAAPSVLAQPLPALSTMSELVKFLSTCSEETKQVLASALQTRPPSWSPAAEPARSPNGESTDFVRSISAGALFEIESAGPSLSPELASVLGARASPIAAEPASTSQSQESPELRKPHDADLMLLSGVSGPVAVSPSTARQGTGASDVLSSSPGKNGTSQFGSVHTEAPVRGVRVRLNMQHHPTARMGPDPKLAFDILSPKSQNSPRSAFSTPTSRSSVSGGGSGRTSPVSAVAPSQAPPVLAAESGFSRHDVLRVRPSVRQR